jgi:hypothetical protein
MISQVVPSRAGDQGRPISTSTVPSQDSKPSTEADGSIHVTLPRSDPALSVAAELSGCLGASFSVIRRCPNQTARKPPQLLRPSLLANFPV